MSDFRHRRATHIRLVRSSPAGTQPPDATRDEATRPDGSPDWSVLMAHAQRGDRDAYRRLLQSITPYLRGVASRHGVRPDAVEDVVQDILATVHLVRHTYDPTRPFGPWLLTVAMRRVVDTLRREGRLDAREVPLDDEHETLAGATANLMEEATDARVLREAIERLPPGQRDAIRMLKLEEMSLKEAAVASGMTVAALKVAVHRGLKSLRKLLAKGDGK
ncbi:sigma-70 family RNA polymerase sigma factor [Paraburkholderia sp. BL10I2N1]|uniref:sigma-70 family RNA polymerase sigma factor n=1 Tax=Paraburkholderia sp. BL10I2N1 TaxID=1938796 RepID=UPI00105CBD00|nr:sigma-70 family RNA polymerase sigma factor [Paraburkholderia sp. BL10I2N1]TDN64024.1 RNA polymerase ECF family sigma subunit [Paraburkholderia sp. BL10I2N1]